MPCSAFLGCTFGKSNLVARIRGKMAFSFFVRGADKRVRLVFEGRLRRGARSRGVPGLPALHPVRSALRREGPGLRSARSPRASSHRRFARSAARRPPSSGCACKTGALSAATATTRIGAKGSNSVPSPAATGGFSFDVRDLWFTRGTCVRNTSERASYYTHSNKRTGTGRAQARPRA